jgi:hypothetical protein
MKNSRKPLTEETPINQGNISSADWAIVILQMALSFFLQTEIEKAAK